MNKIKNKKVPNGYQMVSFDMKSLFTNCPLDRTIQLVLKRIYEKHDVSTNITKQEMTEMLILCKKNFHFTFNEEVYKQRDGVAMGSPLGPVLADIFMVELENNMVSVLQENLSFWKRYADDTICFVKIGTISYITKILNNFDSKIKFTYEVEKDCKLTFLDELLIKKGNNIITTIYRKATTNDIYLNWKSFAPTTWKRGTLKTLAERAYLICSSIALSKKEIDHLKKVFHEKNDYPKWVIHQVLNEVEEKHKTSVNDVSKESKVSPVTDLKRYLLILPY